MDSAHVDHRFRSKPSTDSGNPQTLTSLHRIQWSTCTGITGQLRLDSLLAFRRITQLVKAGLTDMRFHDLRHTSITLLLNEMGAPIKEAQHRAGHSRPSTTMDIYAGEINSKMDSQMADGLDNLITPVPVKITPKTKVDAGK